MMTCEDNPVVYPDTSQGFDLEQFKLQAVVAHLSGRYTIKTGVLFEIGRGARA